MITTSLPRHYFIFSILLFSTISALNLDGTILLSFKHSLISNPSSLPNWNQSDRDPCSWSGVTCTPKTGDVIALLLPNSQLSGSIPDDLGRLQHLRLLDLTNNSINGTLPVSIFNCSELQTLSLSSNFISGELPAAIANLQVLQVLNLSNNAFTGKLPESLGSLSNLREVSFKSNNFSGGVPGGFDSVEVLDLSSNSFSGTLPTDFGGLGLTYLNLSNNKISGSVVLEFAEKIPANAVVDLSFNNFTGEIPPILSNQNPDYFAGNPDLCGKPVNKICTVLSSHSYPPNVSSDVSATAAIAAIPKTTGDHGGRKLNSWKIIAIVVGDVAAMVILVIIFFYAYRFRKKKTNQNAKEIVDESRACSCYGGGTEFETSETATEYEFGGDNEYSKNEIIGVKIEEESSCLVMVDGETELEMERLLKAPAYILGSSGGSIVYKAVVGGGVGGGGGAEVAFAVRRMGECRVEKMKEFEKIVRGVSKFRHRNLVRVRGFYWGEEEKLVIYDYVSNGSLAAAGYGSSSCRLSTEIRLKIAKGIAKGLSYIHEKKHVHGNLKPNNILLTSEMDSVITDFGLQWLISGKTNYTVDKSTHNFSSKRSTSSLEQTMIIHHLHYRAPESMETLKSNPKWDVYSFGIILIELFSGKVFSEKERSKLWNTDSTISDLETKIATMIDEFSGIDVHGR